MELEELIEQKNIEKNTIRCIIGEHNIKLLIESDEKITDSVFSALVYELFPKLGDNKLNRVQKIISLSKTVTDKCFSEGLISVMGDEELFFRLSGAVEALREIGADKTAGILEKFISMMPPDCFWEHVMPDTEWLLSTEEKRASAINLDSMLCGKPDGSLSNFFKTYLLGCRDPQLLFEGL